MTVTPDIKTILLKSYAMWCAYASAFFGALAIAEPTIWIPIIDAFIPESAYKWVSLFFVVLMPFARSVWQNLHAKTSSSP